MADFELRWLQSLQHLWQLPDDRHDPSEPFDEKLDVEDVLEGPRVLPEHVSLQAGKNQSGVQKVREPYCVADVAADLVKAACCLRDDEASNSCKRTEVFSFSKLVLVRHMGSQPL